MVKVFSSDELYDFLYQDDYDKFKITINDLKDRINYFQIENSYWRNDFYIIKFINDKIVGILDYVICVDGPTFQGHYHFLSYVSVDEEFQNQGIAKELLQYWIQNCYNSNKGLCGCSGFTESGYKFLKPILERLPIQIEMEDKISF